MPQTALDELIRLQNAGKPRGITAVCTAHPIVLAAALDPLHQQGPVLIEATCNQVNQDGGYTGMTPANFRAFVHAIADQAGFDVGQLILGGDHLGPNPWRHLSAAEAMIKAKAMTAAYASAGFTKIHLDASMACADDPSPLPDQVIADRAAALAAVAEANGAGQRIVYVIGTEVPPPGGATEHIDKLDVTSPAAAASTVELHRQAFADADISMAFERVIGLVVQPGVEFGHENFVAYDRRKARALTAARSGIGLVYEAHSTDYQTEAALTDLVRDGFAILKVGPWLTFALRETLYGLDAIAGELTGNAPLRVGMEALMVASPAHWSDHYHGTSDEQALLRHFSYSDRIRYYWATPEAQALVQELMNLLDRRNLPETLVSQYLPKAWDAVIAGNCAPKADDLLRVGVQRVLAIYNAACRPPAE